jgi:hypothetical protein
MSHAVDVEFICINCGAQVSQTVDAAEPDFRRGQETGECYPTVECAHCQESYDLYVTTSMSSAEISCTNHDIDIGYGIQYYDDFDDEYFDSLTETNLKKAEDIFDAHINSAIELLKIEATNHTEFSLLVMLHGHVISAIEGYLESTYIRLVTEHQDLMQKAIKTDPVLKDRKFLLSEFFDFENKLKNIVGKRLAEIIFHNTHNVTAMYRNVLNHDFGDISWFVAAVSIRHHCVHRAGYDKEGNPVELSKASIKELIAKAYEIKESVSQTALYVETIRTEIDDF